MTHLVDTNVMSTLRDLRRADPKFGAWAKGVDVSQYFLSVITIFEIELGIAKIERRDRRQSSLLRRWLQDHVLAPFAHRILVVDEAVALRSARLHVPDPRPDRDAFIAATALVHNLTVVTRNVRDFAPMGVRVLNPWE